MGRPSLITVDQLELTNSPSHDGTDDNKHAIHMEARFRLLGRVEIDNEETIEIQ